VRRSKGVFLPPVSPGPVRRGALHRALKTALLDGVLEPGARLPSTREAAGDYGVSRGLVEEVFSELADEGFLERSVGRGTFVSRAVSRVAPRDPYEPADRTAAISRRGRALSRHAACREPETPGPFNAGVADASHFPWKIWQRLEARALRELGPRALSFADPRGLPRLRASIAHYLAQFRGIRATADQIVIFNSAQQALDALAALLLNRGDIVALEDPCYLGARAAFELAGARIAPMRVDADGVRADTVARLGRRARLIYVTPSNQYPTGVSLGLERRVALLDHAAAHRGWIIEDDYDGEFRYERQRLTPLVALDHRGRVLYLGTLNKSMFISLRVAFALVPRSLVEPLANIRTQLDGFTAPWRQMAVSLFMDEGHFASHLRHMRSVYGAKRELLLATLAPMRELGWSWPANAAGMHVMVRHPTVSHVRAVASGSGLDLALLSAYRLRPARGDGLFLRFGALEPRAIGEGARRLLETAAHVPAG
jgi:GntR family transcriptional regulator/MocR family aminotransferase